MKTLGLLRETPSTTSWNMFFYLLILIHYNYIRWCYMVIIQQHKLANTGENLNLDLGTLYALVSESIWPHQLDVPQNLRENIKRFPVVDVYTSNLLKYEIPLMTLSTSKGHSPPKHRWWRRALKPEQVAEIPQKKTPRASGVSNDHILPRSYSDYLCVYIYVWVKLLNPK